jgi:hypothetical protein
MQPGSVMAQHVIVTMRREPFTMQREPFTMQRDIVTM